MPDGDGSPIRQVLDRAVDRVRVEHGQERRFATPGTDLEVRQSADAIRFDGEADGAWLRSTVAINTGDVR